MRSSNLLIIMFSVPFLLSHSPYLKLEPTLSIFHCQHSNSALNIRYILPLASVLTHVSLENLRTFDRCSWLTDHKACCNNHYFWQSSSYPATGLAENSPCSYYTIQARQIQRRTPGSRASVYQPLHLMSLTRWHLPSSPPARHRQRGQQTPPCQLTLPQCCPLRNHVCNRRIYGLRGS